MKKLLIIIAFFCLPNLVLGQDTISKIKKLRAELQIEKVDTTKVSKNIAISKLYLGKKNDSALYYLNNALLLAKKIKSNHHIAKAYNDFGNYYEFINTYEQAIINFTEASLYFKKDNNSNCEAKTYKKIAENYVKLFSEEKAIEFYYKSLAIYSRNNNEIGVANNFNGIGNLYYSEENYDFAKKYFEDALLIYVKYDDKKGISSAYTNIGNVISDQGNYLDGLKYYEKSIAIGETLNDQYGIAINYNNIGDSYIKLGQYDIAEDYFYKSLKIARTLDDQAIKAIVFLNLADIQFNLKNYKKTINNARKSLNISLKIGELEYQAYNLLYLASSYENLGNNENALLYNKKYIKLKDSLAKMDKSKKVNLFNALNNLNKSIYTINELSAKNDLAELKYATGEKFMKFLIIAMVFFAIFLVILITQQADKKKAYNLLEYKNYQINKMNAEIQEQSNHLKHVNQTKDKFFSIIAHDLKNPFNSIKGFSELMIENMHEYDDEKKLKFLKVIKESALKASSLLDNLLTWAHAQSGKLSFKLKKLNLKNEVSNVISLIEIQAVNKEITLINTVENELFVEADENMLGTILRNLISNAIKFTQLKGQVQISSNSIGNFMEISVKDTGVGISESDLEKLFCIDVKYSNTGTANEQGSGLGLVLCREFVEKHGGEIWVNSTLDKGSEFIFTIPKWKNKTNGEPHKKIKKVLLNI